MEEDNDDDPILIPEVNIDYTVQKQILQRLKNKYNVNSKESTYISTTNSGESQQKLVTNSKNTNQTDSSSDDTSQQSISQNSQSKVRSKDKAVKISNKNKTKFENIVLAIDPELLVTYGKQLLNDLDVSEITYEVKKQIYPNSVTWFYPSNDKEFETVLVFFSWKDIVDYVSSNSLIKHIQSILEILSDKEITLGLYGLENYFKYWKSQKQSDKQGKKSDKKYNEYKDSIKISRFELEYALTELEVRCHCCHRFIENTQDILDMIGQFTKSIAQLPEKLEKNDKYKHIDFYLMKDNRDCVMVDKKGNGFKRLWQQQLTTFDLVRLETAEAIMSKYPTPSQLFEAYEKCSSKSEAIKLLEDLPIRRAAGPLTSFRKIGPELSSKIYNFLNGTEGETVI